MADIEVTMEIGRTRDMGGVAYDAEWDVTIEGRMGGGPRDAREYLVIDRVYWLGSDGRVIEEMLSVAEEETALDLLWARFQQGRGA